MLYFLYVKKTARCKHVTVCLMFLTVFCFLRETVCAEIISDKCTPVCSSMCLVLPSSIYI